MILGENRAERSDRWSGPKESRPPGHVHLFAGIEIFHFWELNDWLNPEFDQEFTVLADEPAVLIASHYFPTSLKKCGAHPTTSISPNWGIINNHVTPQSHVENPQLEHMSF